MKDRDKRVTEDSAVMKDKNGTTDIAEEDQDLNPMKEIKNMIILDMTNNHDIVGATLEKKIKK
jgi:hypothetical protein